jgi:diadenosine tetraphosphate (Ap4A) HIT family hydrolase
MATCHICADNRSQDTGADMWGVARLTTGYVRLNPNQYFRGSCFFLAKSCVYELHDFDRATRDAHLAEMAEVAAAVWDVFRPRKLNYEALGNGAPHLHWWLTPRYETDPRPIGPIWEDMEFLRAQWTNGCRPSEEEREALRSELLTALASRDVTIELPFHEAPYR